MSCEHDYLSWHAQADCVTAQRWERLCVKCGTWQQALSPRPGRICIGCFEGVNGRWPWRLLTLPIRYHRAFMFGWEGHLSPGEDKVNVAVMWLAFSVSLVGLVISLTFTFGDWFGVVLAAFLSWLLWKVKRREERT